MRPQEIIAASEAMRDTLAALGHDIPIAHTTRAALTCLVASGAVRCPRCLDTGTRQESAVSPTGRLYPVYVECGCLTPERVDEIRYDAEALSR